MAAHVSTAGDTVQLDLTKVPEGRRNEALLSLEGAVMSRGVGLDLTVGAKDVPGLPELVSHVRGTLKLSAQNSRPDNLLRVASGLDANQQGGLKRLELDWEGCHYSGEAFRALVGAIGRQPDMEFFELCLYQEEREEDIVLDESVGEAVGKLLQNGTLKHLRFVNWFGYVMSTGFVRKMSKGLARSTSVTSFELRNCALPRASYGFLTSALRIRAASMTELTVGINCSSVEVIRDLFETVNHLKNLRSVRICPCLLPSSEAEVLSMLEVAVRQNPSIHYVGGLNFAIRNSFRRRLELLLEANRFISQHRAALDTPDLVPHPVWPGLLARMGQSSGTRSYDPVVRRHSAHHLSQAVRKVLPWLLALSDGQNQE